MIVEYLLARSSERKEVQQRLLRPLAVMGKEKEIVVVDNGSDIFASGYQLPSNNESALSWHLGNQIARSIPRTNILVVEQNPSIQDMLCWALELAGYRAIALTPDHIIRIWNDCQMLSSEEIALLLLDLSIPWEREGVKFLHSLRAHLNISLGVTLPVVILTTSEQIYQELSEQGEQVEKKPFHINQLLARIHTLLAPSRPDDLYTV